MVVDLGKEGLRARWRGQKSTIFVSPQKAVDACWAVVRAIYMIAALSIRDI
jgi:hypothetical protein